MVKFCHSIRTKDIMMMRAHMKLHIDGKQKCEICSRIFPNKKALRNHKVIHREHKFVCTVCSRGFHRPSKLKVNQIQIHASHD